MDNTTSFEHNCLFQDSEVDISLIEYNLSLSYEERLKQHQEALNLYLLLPEEGKKMSIRKILHSSYKFFTYIPTNF